MKYLKVSYVVLTAKGRNLKGTEVLSDKIGQDLDDALKAHLLRLEMINENQLEKFWFVEVPVI